MSSDNTKYDISSFKLEVMFECLWDVARVDPYFALNKIAPPTKFNPKDPIFVDCLKMVRAEKVKGCPPRVVFGKICGRSIDITIESKDPTHIDLTDFDKANGKGSGAKALNKEREAQKADADAKKVEAEAKKGAKKGAKKADGGKKETAAAAADEPVEITEPKGKKAKPAKSSKEDEPAVEVPRVTKDDKISKEKGEKVTKEKVAKAGGAKGKDLPQEDE
jgi:hypothetical protein